MDKSAAVVTDAILAAMPAMMEAGIPDLVWAVSETSYADDYHTIPTKYTIRWQDEDEYRAGWHGGFSFHNSAEAVKAAANTHNRRTLIAAIGMGVE
jgi:hypothetical protein